MARPSEFYKGARKKRNYAIVPFVIVLLIISVIVVLFYSMQKYAVITDDGLKIKLPALEDSNSEEAGTSATGDEQSYEIAETNVILNGADYSGIEAKAGAGLNGVRAIFIPFAEVLDPEAVGGYASRLNSGNALLFELKKADGYLAWYSDSITAANYGLNMSAPESKAQLENMVASLKAEKSVYCIAQISCCVDDLFASHCTTVGLRNQYGMHYGDTYGYYLDPYSQLARDYTVELVNELYEIGFDEVVLQDVRHPVIELDEDGQPVNDIQFTYTREMSTEPDASGAVCGFAVNVAEALADRPKDKVLSIYVNSAKSLVKQDEDNGQNGPLFAKIYDRLYYSTDKYAYTFNIEDIRPSITVGRAEDRFVPVVINYLPENSSWILIDQEDD